MEKVTEFVFAATFPVSRGEENHMLGDAAAEETERASQRRGKPDSRKLKKTEDKTSLSSCLFINETLKGNL